MRRPICLLLSLAASFATPAAGVLTLRQRDIPAVVGLDIQRTPIEDDPTARRLLRRDRGKTVHQTIYNTGSFYFCNVTLGTPGQPLLLVLDTGSSDLWCNAADSKLCASTPDHCSTSGSFDPGHSSTFTHVSSDFNISYADHTGASGDYVTDRLRIGDVSIKDFQFGLASASDSSVGVLGIGYSSNEAQVRLDGKDSYRNLPQAMAKDGLINSNAYSLWLNDLSANRGSVLFGGVDTEKFHGDLETLPIQKVDGHYTQLIIALTGVSLSSGSQHHSYSSDSLAAAVLLDSGSTLTYLPNSLVKSIYKDLNVTYDQSTGNAFVPCDIAKDDINITYTFSSPKITVGINELVINAGDLYFEDRTRACVFGIAPAGQATAILGDTFLRSAYVVYDLANNEISLANTNFNSAKSNVLEIGAGSDSVPSATRVSNPVTTVTAGGAGARIGGATGGITGVPSRGLAPAISVSTSMISTLALMWCGWYTMAL